MTTETLLIYASFSLRELHALIQSGAFVPHLVKPAGTARFAVYGEGEGVPCGHGNRRIVSATTGQVQAVTGLTVTLDSAAKVA